MLFLSIKWNKCKTREISRWFDQKKSFVKNISKNNQIFYEKNNIFFPSALKQINNQMIDTWQAVFVSLQNSYHILYPRI